jgi:hypothetical protein
MSYNTYYYPLDVDPVAVYYWFFAGVLLKLPEIDKQERLVEAQAKGVRRKEMREMRSQRRAGVPPVEATGVEQREN